MTQRSANHVGLPRRTSSDTDGTVQRVLHKLENTDQNLTVLRLLANAPATFRPFVKLSSALLYDGVLPPEIRELVILWLAQDHDTSYEWEEHVPIARRCGVDDEQIAAVGKGEMDLTGPGPESLALRIASGLRAGQGVSAEDFAEATSTWGTDGALELVLAVGFWGGLVPTMIEALGLVGADVHNPPGGPK